MGCRYCTKWSLVEITRFPCRYCMVVRQNGVQFYNSYHFCRYCTGVRQNGVQSRYLKPSHFPGLLAVYHLFANMQSTTHSIEKRLNKIYWKHIMKYCYVLSLNSLPFFLSLKKLGWCTALYTLGWAVHGGTVQRDWLVYSFTYSRLSCTWRNFTTRLGWAWWHGPLSLLASWPAAGRSKYS